MSSLTKRERRKKPQALKSLQAMVPGTRNRPETNTIMIIRKIWLDRGAQKRLLSTFMFSNPLCGLFQGYSILDKPLLSCMRSTMQAKRITHGKFNEFYPSYHKLPPFFAALVYIFCQISSEIRLHRELKSFTTHYDEPPRTVR